MWLCGVEKSSSIRRTLPRSGGWKKRNRNNEIKRYSTVFETTMCSFNCLMFVKLLSEYFFQSKTTTTGQLKLQVKLWHHTILAPMPPHKPKKQGFKCWKVVGFQNICKKSKKAPLYKLHLQNQFLFKGKTNPGEKPEKNPKTLRAQKSPQKSTSNFPTNDSRPAMDFFRPDACDPLRGHAFVFFHQGDEATQILSCHKAVRKDEGGFLFFFQPEKMKKGFFSKVSFTIRGCF